MWTLILTVAVYSDVHSNYTQSVAISSALGFASESACLQAGKAWAENNKKLIAGRTAGTAICVRNSVPEDAPKRPALKY